jgi:hypothetical protein
MSFPLQKAKLCLEKDCESVFSGGGDKCIACGSSQWVWLSKYITSLKENQNEKSNKDLIRNNDYTGRIL